MHSNNPSTKEQVTVLSDSKVTCKVDKKGHLTFNQSGLTEIRDSVLIERAGATKCNFETFELGSPTWGQRRRGFAGSLELQPVSSQALEELLPEMILAMLSRIVTVESGRNLSGIGVLASQPP